MINSPLSILPHNDIHFGGNNSLQTASGSEAVGQNVRQRLKHFLSEWWLATETGTDWFGYVLGKQPASQPISEAIIKERILDTPGVADILEFQASYDRASRGLRVSRVVVKTIYNETVSIAL